MSPTHQLLNRLLGACGMELVAVDQAKENDVDRTLIRQNLALTPGQRLENAAAAWNNTAAFRKHAS
jgi:hypothetical protein